ncbi:MAG: di-trans,poly-cis-decaprenylcistransferase [Candidatus Portnoybacteria bacterium RIFCSPHIGHO2_02_FULL_40_23]|nr:MAG: di-trans,poly-cis-decaprenylcistransferase [Candidatus Portnoybacteria bacterium RIFCSPHIGHO2_02_FULL_40_23]
MGHRAGVKSLEKILQVVRDSGLPCFSFWGASKDNVSKRPKQEVRFLLELFRMNFARLIKDKDIYRLKVKVNIFGAWPELFPPRIKKPMEAIIEATKDHNQRLLNFFIAYNGTDEMMHAIKKISLLSKKQKDLKITEQLIKNSLWTKDLPPVDLIIRTGLENDPHNSAGFMMWDSANSQLYFTNTYWPDFTQREFLEAVENYNQRERRLGK